MKKQILTPILLLVAMALGTCTFTSCLKKTEATPVVKQPDEESESTQDANDTREETDAVLDETNQVMSDNKSKLGRIDADTNNINATSVTITDSVITIVYNNSISKDLKRTKTGTVVIKRIGTLKFHEAGGSFSIEYKDLKITRTVDQKSITINGEHIIKNTTGGYAWAALFLENAAKVTHEITGTIKVTFKESIERTWTVSRSRSYDYLSITIGQISGKDYIEQGKNRRGNDFTTRVPSGKEITAQYNVAANQSKIISGTIEHTVTVNSVATKVTAEFGYKEATVKALTFADVKGYQVIWQKGAITAGPYFIRIYL